MHLPGAYVHVVVGAGAVVEPGAVSVNELPLSINIRHLAPNRAKEETRNGVVCDEKHTPPPAPAVRRRRRFRISKRRGEERREGGREEEGRREGGRFDRGREEDEGQASREPATCKHDVKETKKTTPW